MGHRIRNHAAADEHDRNKKRRPKAAFLIALTQTPALS
ncbi:hypothetical protein LG3211_4200 [Lysobacter gummosus]|nr:hypothetical protein LG3211_4200 [Lysobacter gummosus]